MLKWLRNLLPGGGQGQGLRLQPGDPAPAFECEDHLGQLVSSEQLAGTRYLLWFYPMADTPG